MAIDRAPFVQGAGRRGRDEYRIGWIDVTTLRIQYEPMNDSRLALGFMSGTSLDGLDAAVIRAEGTGPDLHATVAAHVETTFEPDDPLIENLRAFARGEPSTSARIAEIARELGLRHAAVLTAAADAANIDPRRDLDLVAMHGQTVTHRPPVSWQLADPWPVATAVDCPVVCDLRGADLAMGGRGAPITPSADAVLLRHRRSEGRTLLVLNLGGFANATLLPGNDAEPVGFDCCPCNHLLDAASRVALDVPFDRDGEATDSGKADPVVVEGLVDVIAALERDDRSGGDGDEHADAAEAIARDARDAGHPEDALASIAEAICRSIATSVQRRIDAHDLPPLESTLVAGGGIRNLGLFRALATILPGPVESSEAAGLPPQAREAACMAVLGLLAVDGVPVTTAASTGRNRSTTPDGLWIRPPRA